MVSSVVPAHFAARGAARALGPGTTVTVRTVVLNGPELGNIRYIQDADAGLALYAQPAKLPSFGALRAGDSIQVTGQLKSYNGLLEMPPPWPRYSSWRPMCGCAPFGCPPVAQGTTYYVEVSSRNAVGSETATPVPFITGNGKRNRAGTRN